MVARLVRNEKVGGSNPPSSTTGRHPIRMSVFCMPGRGVVALVVPLVFRAPSGPAAREIATREPEGSEWSISKPARALRTLRRPPHRRRLVADVWLSASSRSPARPRRPRGGLQSVEVSVCCPHRPCRRPRAPQAGPPVAPAPFTPVGRGAGVCSVSGETDDTIASQIHPFLVLFHRAKASWVSYRRPEVPALVLTVTCCGAVSSMGATKFARRCLSVTIARKYAPSVGRMAQNERFIAGWASVFASVGGWGVYWANFSALRHLHQVPKPSTGTEAEPFHACLPSRPTKVVSRIVV